MIELIKELLKREWEFSVFHMGTSYVMSLMLGNDEHIIVGDSQAIKMLDEIQTFW